MYTFSDRGPYGSALTDSTRAGLTLGLTLGTDPMTNAEIAYRRERLLRAGSGQRRVPTPRSAPPAPADQETVSRWTSWRPSVRWQRSSVAARSWPVSGH